MTFNAMPKVQAIAGKAELSRTTVYKHIKEFEAHPVYVENKQSHRILHCKLLGKLYNLALIEWDVKAAKLYMEATGGLRQNKVSSVRQQHNNIQINNTCPDSAV